MTLKMQFGVMVLMVLLMYYGIVCVDGISIDGQLTVLRNDCYERMAIGEKLSPKQTYKTFEHKTVSKCEMECTQEKEKCRAYSFGIGPKGNATCLLGRNPVKETADLKPVGTISDTDYDLYIKKLDCHLVVEPPQPQATQATVANPQNFAVLQMQPQQTGYGVQEHHHQEAQSGHYENLPAQSNYHSSISSPVQNFSPGYYYDKPNNNNFPANMRPPPKKDGLHHVQTLVSIASGPQSVLHPVHDILVSQDSYGEAKPVMPPLSGGQHAAGDRPPFRPPVLNHPYQDDRRPSLLPEGHQESHHKPDPGYEHLRPLWGASGYGYPANDDRPDPTDYGPRPPKLPDYRYGSGGTHQLIDRRKYYESVNQFNSFESDEVHRYGPENPKFYDANYNFYDHYDKPKPNNYPNRYGSVIPHPDDYSRPDNHYDYLFVRPNSELRPHYGSHLPPSAAIDYDRPDRPPRPRPEYDERRPLNGHSGYDRRPSGGRPYSEYYEKPGQPSRPGLGNFEHSDGYERPDGGPLRPAIPQKGGNQGYISPSRLDKNWNKTPSTNRPPGDTSRPPSTELSNHYGGVDYTNKQYGKPEEDRKVKGEGGGRQIVTESIGHHGEKITSVITELPNGE